MEIRRIRTRDIREVLGLLDNAFSAEFHRWDVNLSRAERLLRFLLAGGRFPLRCLRVLGLEFEIWVATEGEKVIGALGQLEGKIPSLSGIAVAPEAQGKGVAKALLRHAFADLRKKGWPLVLGSVRAENEKALELCRSVGMEPYGELKIYAVPFPPRALPVIPKGITVRPATKRDIDSVRSRVPEGLAPKARLDAAYSPWCLRLLGIHRSSLVAEVEGELQGFIPLQVGQFWKAATIGAPLLFGPREPIFLALLAGAVARAFSFRPSTLHIVLPTELLTLEGIVVHMGGEPIGTWVQLVRYLNRREGDGRAG